MRTYKEIVKNYILILAEITKSGLAQDCVADLEDRFLQKEKTVSPQ